MIGVLADDGDMPWVEEFFELFKTPWERAVKGRDYRVVLSTDGCDVDVPGELTLIYGSEEAPLDRRLSAIMARSGAFPDLQVRKPPRLEPWGVPHSAAGGRRQAPGASASRP